VRGSHVSAAKMSAMVSIKWHKIPFK
jgi:hypothetical protein